MREPNKWKMNRVGLFNFWYYHTMEVFDFADGKLLLRGSNGSGKSVTMQSLLPVLLDGRRSPERLDPFGSRARKMEDYLLGEKEVGGRDERTGYLFIEYKRTDTEQYITTGIGLQARRQKQMNFWGFAITDNRRVGKDFDLFEMETQAGKKQQIPLSRVQLENRIGDGGEVVRSQSDYMHLVNKLLFGFETDEAFADLIQLLLQLRSPKLSKDFKPTVIYEILEKALPPLTDEDLRHLSDTIEHMDGVKQQIEQLERERGALNKLIRHYDEYNTYKLAEKAEAYKKTKHRLTKAEKEIASKQREAEALAVEVQALESRNVQLHQSKKVAEEKRTRLQGHGVWQIEREKADKLEQLSKYSKDRQAKLDKLENRKRQERAEKEQLVKTEESLDETAKTMEQQLEDLQDHAENAVFGGHPVNEQDFQRLRKSGYDFAVWHEEAERHDLFLNEIIEKLRELEQLRNDLAEHEKKQADKQLEIDKLRMEAADWQNVFETDKQNQLDAIHVWAKRHSFFEVDETLLGQTARLLDDLYEPFEYGMIREPFWKLNENYRTRLYEKKVRVQNSADLLKQRIDEKEADLMNWEQRQDPEPVFRDEATIEARSLLAKEGRRHSPFFEAVEFRADVPEPTRNRLEAALLESGILDALIVEEEGLDIHHDRIIVPAPNLMAHTLADYLVPDCDDSVLPQSVVDDVLRSIVVGEDLKGEGSGFSIAEDGTYVIGLLQGHAAPVDAVRFIGRTARERFRQQEIARLAGEIEMLQTEEQELEQMIQALDDDFQKAESAMEDFPTDQDLSMSFQQIRQKRFEMNELQKVLLQMDEEIRKRKQAFLELKRSVDMETRGLDLEQTHPAYTEAQLEMRLYKRVLQKLELAHKDEGNLASRSQQLKERLEEIIYEVDELQGEINTIAGNIEQLTSSLAEIETQLKSQGVEDVRREIEAVRVLLEDVEKELDQNKEQLPVKQVRMETLHKQIVIHKQEAGFLSQLVAGWKAAFFKERAYGFVEGHGVDDSSPEQQLDEVAEQYRTFLEQKDLSKIEENLTKAYNEQFANLLEYRMQDSSDRLDSSDWEAADWTESQQIEFANWQRMSTRRLIQLDFQGKRVSPYFIRNSVDADYERQSHALEEEDRRLYEEILFDSVGNMLRSRITRAQNWAEKMDKLMRGNDSSSGLSFSIQWKPRSAENETELDTNELVDLLRRDPRLMKEADLNRIIEHFRSKIDRAKEEVDLQGEGKTLLQVLKSVLDYRYWFSFVLFYKRERETRKELTNHAFDKFSGGEKAMAMYIPLFTACFSRYQEAAPTAPHIITLDEAFAGVDENNISMMFGIVEELGFDFIMNSQVLWGDYETISALSICELIRPKNADFVSVMRYHWNGLKRVEVTSKPSEPAMIPADD
ncbi:chromosome segregation atpase-like protein [Bacillus sp. OxB-1]|uniref:TIGR02680 family protein n=1 Tax=Bacillus sp. (strain OxB-1) TaxID=98228 RepID=UPI0005821638|nr:TIGR02680 family protein [Bacillus sp. OxB-1]BAQ10199.1 chromosome segregation atpase-like protein [Bacillus sp. OxB-1]